MKHHRGMEFFLGVFFHNLTVASALFAAALGLRVGFAANRRRCFVLCFSFLFFNYLLTILSNLNDEWDYFPSFFS